MKPYPTLRRVQTSDPIQRQITKHTLMDESPIMEEHTRCSIFAARYRAVQVQVHSVVLRWLALIIGLVVAAISHIWKSSEMVEEKKM